MTFSIWLGILLGLVVASQSQPTFLPATPVSPTPESDLATALGVAAAPGTSFEKVQTKDNVTKWTQTVNSIPVYGSVLTTHTDELGNINEVQGVVSQTVSLVETQPEITGDIAVDVLRNEWGHGVNVSDILTLRIDSPQLQILQTGDGFDKLVYKVSYYVDRKDRVFKSAVDALPGNITLPAFIKGLVNAHTGEVEKTWNDLQHLKIWGITGNRNTGGKFHQMEVGKASHWDCRHQDRSKRIEVFDMWGRREWTDATTSRFQCSRADDANWDLFSRTGAYSPRNEAFVNANRFIDLWTDVIGNEIQPYRDNSSMLRFYVHYDQRYENAFFNGEGFYFGDGYTQYYPMMTLDILCHEVGHSVTAWKGGAMEYWRESGAMNEAYSDILGETCDIGYNRKNDYLIAKEVMRPTNTWGPAWRNMCNPRSIRNALDHYSQYNDQIDVHYTSGIYNKAWCTLTKTRGWDYIKAFEVFTHANLMYWNPTVTMHCGACGVETAAADRGYSKADVTAAFTTVGVSCGACSRRG